MKHAAWAFRFLPPDVNESDLYFTPIGEAIRSDLPRSRMLERTRRKRFEIRGWPPESFKALYDFCERIEPRFLNKRVFESLIKSGRSGFVGSREAMTASIDDALACLHGASRCGVWTTRLFGGGGATELLCRFCCAMRRLWSEEERLASEYAMLGFMFPGIRWKNTVPRLGEWSVVRPGKRWKGQRNGKEIAVACADRWRAADAFEKGRALGNLYDSGYDRRAGVAGVPESFSNMTDAEAWDTVIA